jgi:hypothetical protein
MGKVKTESKRDHLNMVEQNRLNEYCAREGITRAELMIRVLREFLEKHG